MKVEDLIEVHVYDNGKWRIEERYKGSEKDDAIAAAKRLITNGSEATKVVRETYDEASGLFKQRTLYREGTPKSKPQEQKASPARPAPIARSVQARPLAQPASKPEAKPDPARQTPPKEAPEATVSIGQVLRRVALATTGVIALGGVGGVVLMEQFGLGIGLPSRYLMFSIALLIVAFVVALFLYARTRRLLTEEAELKNAQAKKAQAAPPPPATLSEMMATSRAGEAIAPPQAAAGQPAAENTDWSSKFDEALAKAKTSAPKAEAEAAPAAVEPVKQVVEAPKKPEDKHALPVASDDDRIRLRDFFKNCLLGDGAKLFTDTGPDGKRKRFACHLFLLGAGDAVMSLTGRSLPPNQLGTVLQMALAMLGTSPQRASEFAARIEEYRKDRLYSGTIEAGRNAMAEFLSGKGVPGTALAEALTSWVANPETQPGQVAPTGDIAILFTDMVSSVETTQALGDEGAMRLVQAHNLIVGTALKKHRGHQVKHTGDGIMAVFPRVGDAVKAAVSIQVEVAQYNSVTLQRSLALRIGVSSGRPVQEDNDYFGTVVQTAARLSSVGDPGAITVAESVAAQAPTDGFAYDAPIRVPLKGFPEPVTVVPVMWKGIAAPAASASHAESDTTAAV
ncbi:adenylate/guanylate cyclase domain-containing protein [Lacibacterium aquatile]|uniref:Adenylate/guanylate cyclase domain-containing protein n=1 Tax=Lacibacterium aquatile TaxID=1168082 RepID=A0ABW5DT56_9PROT